MSGDHAGCAICQRVTALGALKEMRISILKEWSDIRVMYNHNCGHQYQLACLRSKIISLNWKASQLSPGHQAWWLCHHKWGLEES